MLRPMKRLLLLTLLLLPAALAGAFPDRPVRLVVPYAPGGSSDVLARLMSERMRDALGQPVVIENRPGAGSMLGTDAVAKAAADGHTILLADMPHTIVPAVHGKKTPYHPVEDFAPISLIGVAPLMLFVHPGFAAQDLAELIASAKRTPDRIAIASGGNGSATHLMAALLQAQAGIRLTHVPYKGAGPALNDVVAGQVPTLFTTLATAAPHLKAGRLRALAVSSPVRLADHPSVPTFAESALPQLVVQHWWGVLAPTGVPAAAIERLAQAVAGTIQAADVREKFAAVGVAPPAATGPAALGALIVQDLKRWTTIVHDARITAD